MITTTHAEHSTLANLTVADAMHHGVVTCRRDLSLRGVARVMAGHRVHCVVVTDDTEDQTLWGVVSDLDLVAAAYARDLHEQTADGSAASPVVLVSPGESLDRAAQLRPRTPSRTSSSSTPSSAGPSA